MGDALELDFGTFAPAPTKMVANLPYGVAATVILRTVAELSSIQSWVVMVQREVGERFAAKPGTDAYGVPSVLAQLECDVKVLRPVSRQVFRPVPNVDSVLLGLTRRAGQRASTTETRLVHDAFRHRRKALAGSLELAHRGIRERAREALVEMGLPADVRAERLTPQQFADLAARLSDPLK
jgi:16S rRNA (adenine1518-N6/adenine1519-N6)-dimethyltransferase